MKESLPIYPHQNPFFPNSRRLQLTQQIAGITTNIAGLSSQSAGFALEIERINKNINANLQQIEKIRIDIKQNINDLQATIDKLKSLNAATPLNTDHFTELNQRGIKQIDYFVIWTDLYLQYIGLCLAWDSAMDAYTKNINLSTIPDYNLNNNQLATIDRIIKSSELDAVTLTSAQNVIKDYKATFISLSDLLIKIIAKKNSGLKVRIDAEALKTALPETRQKMTLHFHGQSQEKVKVGDENYETPT